MKDKLEGWDLLIWRLGFEDKGIVPLVGSQITIAGHLDHEVLVKEIENSVENFDVLRMALSKEEFPTLNSLTSFNATECIRVLHNHVNPAQFALRNAAKELSIGQYREDLPLWRLFVIYKDEETLLFPFLHHAIADGRTALEIILRLCDDKFEVRQRDGDNQNGVMSSLLSEIVTNPLSLLQNTAPTLLKLGTLAALSPRHSLYHFANRSFSDEVMQFSIPREVLKAKAKEISVSIHDITVAISIQIIQQLERQLQLSQSSSIRINIPVALGQSESLNQLIIARLFIESGTFEETAKKYQSEFQQWRQLPALKFYSAALHAIATVQRIDLTSFATTSDVTISSLPTIPTGLKLAGHEVKSIWPLVPTMGSAFNITSIGLGSEQFYTFTYDIGNKIDALEVRKAIRATVEKHLEVVPNFQQ